MSSDLIQKPIRLSLTPCLSELPRGAVTFCGMIMVPRFTCEFSAFKVFDNVLLAFWQLFSCGGEASAYNAIILADCSYSLFRQAVP